MGLRARVVLGGIVLLGIAGLAAAGCDAGGLLVVEGASPKKAPAQGHSATDLVSAGNYASNGQYRMFYVLGQPSPGQGVATSAGHRDNGGLTGAVHGE